MGTSSARRAPTTHLWRLAKAAATRYLSPKEGAAVDAREVAVRYVAALGEGGGPAPAGALAAFRLTRRAAQNLGAFGCGAHSRGWPAALADWGLKDLTGEEPAVLGQALSAALEAPGGGLEQAATHAALLGILLKLPEPPGTSLEPAGLVRRFLAAAFHLRLALDLGESLEAAAPELASLRQGLGGLADCIHQAVARLDLPAAPRTSEDWLGLPGWTWVSTLLQDLILNLTAQSFGQDFPDK